jgi:hypothetical protein
MRHCCPSIFKDTSTTWATFSCSMLVHIFSSDVQFPSLRWCHSRFRRWRRYD